MSTATEVEVRFTLAISEGSLQHKGAAEQKAKTAYVLELLRQGDISAGRAAKLLDISRWRLSDLMSEAGICPSLDVGECEAIVLAEEIPADQVILDDRVARGLPVIGTFGVLLVAKAEGIIPTVKRWWHGECCVKSLLLPFGVKVESEADCEENADAADEGFGVHRGYPLETFFRY